MAIFSLNHSFIGRSTHRPGAAADFAKYITRLQACTKLVGERMPQGRGEMMNWLNKQEQDDRKNARVIDKLIVALPVELSHDQNAELLRSFGERVSRGRASWVAAIHDGPADADNPHAHIIFRDRDIDTARRVMMTTEAGSTQVFREAWANEVNLALERHGFEQRVDSRSLQDQGIDREPEIHVGAGAMELARKGHQFESADLHSTRRGPQGMLDATVNYGVIDGGKTRFDENEQRKERNRLRELDNGEYPYAWTSRGGMAMQQHSALIWNSVAQKRLKAEPLDDDDRTSAMAWVASGANRAEEIFRDTYDQGLKADADSYALAEVYGHMDERKLQRSGLDAARDTSAAREHSEIARAIMERVERGSDRGPGLEV